MLDTTLRYTYCIVPRINSRDRTTTQSRTHTVIYHTQTQSQTEQVRSHRQTYAQQQHV